MDFLTKLQDVFSDGPLRESRWFPGVIILLGLLSMTYIVVLFVAPEMLGVKECGSSFVPGRITDLGIGT